MARWIALCLAAGLAPVMAGAATPPSAPASVPASTPAAASLRPNLEGQIAQPLRYRPDNGDFVIENGQEFFNRPLYGGHTAFRVDGGDKPEFVLYLPGRGGNLRLGIRTATGALWLKDAAHIVTRYRPGELIYEVRDPAFGDKAVITVEVLAYAATEGLIVRTQAKDISEGAELIWAYGGVNGQRGSRDGDIGTEKVPISQYFQFQPDFAKDNAFALSDGGFTLKSAAATIAGVVPADAKQHIADAGNWDDLPALLGRPAGIPDRQIVFGEAPLRMGQPLYLSLQRTSGAGAGDLDTYKEVTAGKPAAPANPGGAKLLPAFNNSQLSEMYASTRKHFENLRNKVRIETPDPYLDASVGALNIVSDALWDDDKQAIMHGSIAWRTKLLGWRGPYVLDALGWHDRARRNFDTWLPNQNTSPIPAALPPADTVSNLARNEAGLHSNGDLSNSHYDMNMVFIDALFRHLEWTGDIDYARQAWPVIERHLAWEKRLFRREYGPDHLPLYEAYADIWASDDLYYGGGGTAVASAYNLYANRMAAKVAGLIGKDPAPYQREAELIEQGMRTYLWQTGQGRMAESKDWLGNQLVHPDYALWTFYTTIDEGAVSRADAWLMGASLATDFKPIPIHGPGVPIDRPYHVLPTSDWMPYTWSINNVVMGEDMSAALALWQGGHAEAAYDLAKGALLASQYMGISPGNAGSMNYLDVYRRESQRDFGDSAGTTSRAIVEGLFGVRPDALDGVLTVAPGFPKDWTHARLAHPDLGVDFRRDGHTEVWTIRQTGNRFKTLILSVPEAFNNATSVTVNGRKASSKVVVEASGEARLEVTANAGPVTTVNIVWSGAAVSKTAKWSLERPPAPTFPSIDWNAPISATFDTLDMTAQFNDKLSAIFAPGKYLSPRSPGVSLSLPSQGIGAWAGHVAQLPKIDDGGLRQAAAAHGGRVLMPNGVPFATPSAADAANIAFASQWDNYPRAVTLPLSGQARHVYLLMAGTTNPMQSRMDNGEVIVTYADGTTARLALRNPETWWPIEQDYFIDDYQFRNDAPLPPRIDLKTGQVRVLDRTTFKGKGREIDGGAATVLDLALDPAKPLRSLTVRALSNDVVIGLMSATLERP